MYYRPGHSQLWKKGWARSSCRWTFPSSIRLWSSTSLAFPYPTTIVFLAGLFPEPNSSAAGVRTKFLVEKLAQTKGVEAIHYATSAKAKSSSQSQEELKALGVCFHHVPPNDSRLMEEFLIQAGCKTTEKQPDDSQNVLVIFDRFFAEEFYSQAIHHHCPHATMVLDMQDMHSLRWHRQAIVEGRDATQIDISDKNDYCDSLSNLPVKDFPLAHDVKLQRELASIHRSDLSLVCSPVEMKVLQKRYQIPDSKLCLASFFLDDVPEAKNSPTSNANTLLDFHDRTDFVFIGGFKHAPNVDAVRQMRRLWPRIRAALGDRDVNFHVYGPFCPRPLLEECHDPSNGFYIHGETSKSLEEILAQRRVMLAPIRFGAGIKGKIVDAWKFGTPVVTTPIGSEGIGEAVGDSGNQWGGAVARNSNEFVDNAVALYQDETKWVQASQKGQTLLSDLYGIHHWNFVLATLIEVCNNREARRELDYMRGVLWQQTLRSTEFFSRWIELKNSK